MNKLWMALLAVIVVAGCEPEDDYYYPDPVRADRLACEERGGSYNRTGMYGIWDCVMPAPDAGQSCSRAQDCAGACMADTRTCSTILSPMGCYSYLDENGQILEICID